MSDPLGGRPDLFVVARILERLWRRGEPTLRSHLQSAVNLNYDSTARYVAWLQERGLVVVSDLEDGHTAVAITPKGYRTYAELVVWMDEYIRRRPGGG